MSKPQVKVKRLVAAAILPKYAHDTDSGADLYAISKAYMPPGSSLVLKIGIAIQLPKGYGAQVRPRSGLAAKHVVTVLNAPGSIDENFRGEIGVILINHGKAPFAVEPGDRIAQMVIEPIEQADFTEVSNLTDTDRGEGGFGSTGVATSIPAKPEVYPEEEQVPTPEELTEKCLADKVKTSDGKVVEVQVETPSSEIDYIASFENDIQELSNGQEISDEESIQQLKVIVDKYQGHDVPACKHLQEIFDTYTGNDLKEALLDPMNEFVQPIDCVALEN